MNALKNVIAGAVVVIAGINAVAQTEPASAPRFDVVSIKKSDPDARGGSARTMPDGTTVLTNQPIRFILARAASEPLREIENLPDWAMDRYDVTVKPPADGDRSSLPAMWRALLADRLKLQAHVEHREKDGYALLLARSDGRPGPNLKPSTLDCTPKPQTVPPPQLQGFPTRQEAAARCGMLGGQGYVVSGGMDMARLAILASGFVDGAPVVDRTGLRGYYAIELTYAARGRPGGPPDDIDPNAPPDPVTALREQLGLRLQREKQTIPVLVIDHVERPDPD